MGELKVPTIGIKDVKIGNAQNLDGLTGVTVIICEKGAVAGVDIRGGAPGTRETDLLDPINTVDKVHAIVLSGGSAFGLEASCGVMKYLEEKGFGFDVGVAKVPIVCQAVLFDLYLGSHLTRPDKEMGYSASINANSDFQVGNIGAGTGASVGKIKGMDFAMKSGLGYYEYKDDTGLIVGAIVAVNAFGDVIKDGDIIAGALNDEKNGFANSSMLLSNFQEDRKFSNTNTTIGAVITNADLNKSQCKKVSQVAHNGYARAISPIHTSLDGDTIFTLSTGEVRCSVDKISHIASLAMEKAIHNAIYKSGSLGSLKSWGSLNSKKI